MSSLLEQEIIRNYVVALLDWNCLPQAHKYPRINTYTDTTTCRGGATPAVDSIFLIYLWTVTSFYGLECRYKMCNKKDKGITIRKSR
jgi:hypothetical protein